MSIAASATIAPGEQLVGPATPRPPAARRARRRSCATAAARRRRAAARSSTRAAYGPSLLGAAPRCAPASASSSRSPRRGPALPTWRAAAARARSPRGSACAPRARPRVAGGSPGSEVAGQPAGAQRQRHRDVRLLVHAGGDLERAAADVDDQQRAGRPAEPAAGGEEGQPRLVLAAEHLEVDPGLARTTAAEHLVAVGRLADGAGREGEELLAALVLGDVEALLHERREPVATRRRRSGRPSVDVLRRAAAAILCEDAGQRLRRRGARRPRAGAPVLEPTSRTPRRMRPTYVAAHGSRRH